MQPAIRHNSTHSTHDTPIPSSDLPPVQAQVVAALAQGLTISAAARQAGVHRATIHNWINNESGFKAAMDNAQREYAAVVSDEMRELAASALKTLHKLLEDPETPGFVRLRAALAVLERPQFPAAGWHLPVRVESPQKQQAIDDYVAIKAGYQAMRMAEAIEAGAERITGQGADS
jgi:transposase-like protein